MDGFAKCARRLLSIIKNIFHSHLNLRKTPRNARVRQESKVSYPIFPAGSFGHVNGEGSMCVICYDGSTGKGNKEKVIQYCCRDSFYANYDFLVLNFL